jgi:hypothetical protein
MLISAFISFSLQGILGSLRLDPGGAILGLGILLLGGPTDAVAVPPLPKVLGKETI